MTTELPPLMWDVEVVVHDGMAAMSILISPLPRDPDLLKRLALHLSEQGVAFLVENGIEVTGEMVDISPPPDGEQIQ